MVYGPQCSKINVTNCNVVVAGILKSYPDTARLLLIGCSVVIICVIGWCMTCPTVPKKPTVHLSQKIAEQLGGLISLHEMWRVKSLKCMSLMVNAWDITST